VCPPLINSAKNGNSTSSEKKQNVRYKNTNKIQKRENQKTRERRRERDVFDVVLTIY
jgi:hypothetical protein